MRRFTARRAARRLPTLQRVAAAVALAAVGLALRRRAGAHCFALVGAPPRASTRQQLRAATSVEVDCPVDVQATEAAEAAYEAARAKRAKEANATNATLKLGDGFPGGTDREPTKFGPQWATCFVDTKEAGRLTDHGVTAPRNVLEEWVMRSEGGQLASFGSWIAARASEASVRCVPLSAKSTEDIQCIACASSGGMPFTPEGRVTVTDDGPSIMTFGGLSQCLSSTVGRGFCMKGSLAVPTL